MLNLGPAEKGINVQSKHSMKLKSEDVKMTFFWGKLLQAAFSSEMPKKSLSATHQLLA